MNILNKILEKRGIKDTNELDAEEKQQFEQWRVILAKEELSTEDIKEFCKTQCEIIENKWKSFDILTERKSELIAPYTIYKTLVQAIESPKKGREQLEQYLNDLIK